MPSCVIKHCKSRSGLFRFPQDVQCRQAWLRALNLPLETNSTKDIRVCVEHFDSPQIFQGRSTSGKIKHFLKTDAVPQLCKITKPSCEIKTETVEQESKLSQPQQINTKVHKDIVSSANDCYERHDHTYSMHRSSVAIESTWSSNLTEHYVPSVNHSSLDTDSTMRDKSVSADLAEELSLDMEVTCDENCNDSNKNYVIADEKQILKLCHACLKDHCRAPVIVRKIFPMGRSITIEMECVKGHLVNWCSSEIFRNRLRPS